MGGNRLYPGWHVEDAQKRVALAFGFGQTWCCSARSTRLNGFMSRLHSTTEDGGAGRPCTESSFFVGLWGDSFQLGLLQGTQFLLPLTWTLSWCSVGSQIQRRSSWKAQTYPVPPPHPPTSLLEIYIFPFPRNTPQNCPLNPVLLVAFSLGN